MDWYAFKEINYKTFKVNQMLSVNNPEVVDMPLNKETKPAFTN